MVKGEGQQDFERQQWDPSVGVTLRGAPPASPMSRTCLALLMCCCETASLPTLPIRFQAYRLRIIPFLQIEREYENPDLSLF